jgi:hypothetical protein
VTQVVDGQGVVEAEQQARAAEEGEGVGGLRKHEPPCLQLATLEEAQVGARTSASDPPLMLLAETAWGVRLTPAADAQESRAVALRPEPEPSGQGGEGAAAARCATPMLPPFWKGNGVWVGNVVIAALC